MTTQALCTDSTHPLPRDLIVDAREVVRIAVLQTLRVAINGDEPFEAIATIGRIGSILDRLGVNDIETSLELAPMMSDCDVAGLRVAVELVNRWVDQYTDPALGWPAMLAWWVDAGKRSERVAGCPVRRSARPREARRR